MSAHAKYQKNKNQIWTDSVNKSDFTKLYHKAYNWVQFTDVFGLSSIFLSSFHLSHQYGPYFF